MPQDSVVNLMFASSLALQNMVEARRKMRKGDIVSKSAKRVMSIAQYAVQFVYTVSSTIQKLKKC